jgi:hypothetical protein
MPVETGFINIMITMIVFSIGAMIGVYSQQVDMDIMRKELCKHDLTYCSKEQIINQPKLK